MKPLTNVPLVAAVYARKSTLQDVSEDQKSVERQIENCRVFAAAKGWTVPKALVFSDDAVGGAETKRLVNRKRVLDAIDSGRAGFQALIVRDSSRLSRRDGEEAFAELKRIAKAGVQVWFYQDGTQFSYGSFGENIVGFVRAEMNAEYRRQISRNVTEAMIRKARAGHVVGNKVYGYRNVIVMVGGQRSYTAREIDPQQAVIVVRIFTRVAEGAGFLRVARELNADRIPAQRGGQWSTTSIEHIVQRTDYYGVRVWNKTSQRDPSGDRRCVQRPTNEWIKVATSDPPIISEALFRAATAQCERRAVKWAGKARGGRQRDVDSKYLLSGRARCQVCGSPICVAGRYGKGGVRIRQYGCLENHMRGAAACTNASTVPVECVDRAVLSEIEKLVSSPGFLAKILKHAATLRSTGTRAATIAKLRNDIERAEKARDRFIDAIGNGEGQSSHLVEAMQKKDDEAKALRRELSQREAAAAPAESEREMTRRIKAAFSSVSQKLHGNVAETRALLAVILEGPIMLGPSTVGGSTAPCRNQFGARKDTRSIAFSGKFTGFRLFSGVAINNLSPTVSVANWETDFRGIAAQPPFLRVGAS